jgi:hypothetical protein
MPTLDATAEAALEAQAIRPVFFAYLDIVGDPVRVTTAEASVTFAASGDAELDGTYQAIDPTVVEVGDVINQEGGSDTLTCRLSGIIGPDTDLLNTIGDKANWQGRPAYLWMLIRDENGTNQGAVARYYTGYMVALDVAPAATEQTIVLKIENYLALLSRASNRSYLNQKDYDSGDLSAQATIGAANGAKGPAALVGSGGGRDLDRSVTLNLITSV